MTPTSTTADDHVRDKQRGAMRSLDNNARCERYVPQRTVEWHHYCIIFRERLKPPVGYLSYTTAIIDRICS